MDAKQLKQKFINFFIDKNHQEIPPASLLPENDPSTLFTSSGIQPLVPYFLGQPHTVGKRLVNIQPCVRTGDIDEVGDSVHHTFFEMLGNWSLGDYFKQDMIPWSFQFLTETLHIDPNHLHVTCFAGDDHAPKDQRSADIWQKLGIASHRIHFLAKDNWWGPPGHTGPCGPCSEMFVDNRPHLDPIDFKIGCQQARYVEIWNDVLIQYFKNKTGQFEKLVQDNIDTGMGVERTIAILNGYQDNYLTDIWQPIIKSIETLSGQSYQQIDNRPAIRIIADHIRSAVFIISNSVEPSNKEAGYVLRRLIRRAIRQAKLLGVDKNFCKLVGQVVIDNQSNYAGTYPELDQNKDKILSVLETEESKFLKTLSIGLKKAKKVIQNLYLIKKNQITKLTPKLIGQKAFRIYESFGFPVEMFLEEPNFKTLIELVGKKRIISEFEKAKKAHVLQSQTLSSGRFKSGLADGSGIITKYHTATHLIHSALRQVLGQHVHQAGSNITQDRLRFDFTHTDRLTDRQINQIRQIVNRYIDQSLVVVRQEMSYQNAISAGALAFFATKYPNRVSVYTVGNQSSPVSKEICTGPHVKNTADIGHISITKQESVGSGKRRIYATLSN